MAETAVIVIDGNSRSMYDTKILGMTVFERIKKTLERVGIKRVYTIEDKKEYLLDLDGKISNPIMLLVSPVIITEKRLEVENDSNIIFTSNGKPIGAYIIKKDFFEILRSSSDIKTAIKKYMDEKGGKNS